MKMPEINFKYWMGRGELAKFARALRNYWAHVEAALMLPLEKHDPLKAPIGVVNLMAWERDVNRLGQEPEALFRIRVAHAYGFARDGGSVAGWEEMFATLGYPHITQDERLTGVDWDVISLQIRDGDLSEVPELLDTVIRQYGRTCRRYQYTSYLELPVAARVQSFEGSLDVSRVTTRLNVAALPRPTNFECEYYQAHAKA
ncbi:hemolysin [Enterovibrio norvegicus]|uniref:hemolysin n=1 Tax=Enterovibrio norvegicus TaxID=188144 RepID=UPI000C83179F|nr:hemolysin [Enterovibrio norvegicus]PMN68419.1 hemolysin [Enterovibrio norvegicus]